MILVCGGAGYIGSHMVQELVRQGFDVAALDNLQSGHRAAVDPGARFFEGDLRDEDTLDKIMRLGVTETLHFAANSLVGESVEKPLKYYDNNVHGMEVLLSAMVRHKVERIVFSSTAAVYGEPELTPVMEEAPARPTNPYGETKLAMEKMMEWAAKAHGLRYVSLRYFNVAGAAADGSLGEDHRPETHLIPLVLRVPLGQMDEIGVFGADYDTPDGSCIRDYVHVDDLIQAHLLALEHLKKGGENGVFNLGGAQGFSVFEIIRAAEKVTGRKIKTVIKPRRPGDPARLVADSSKAGTVLGWRPVYGRVEDIIATAWNWRRKHPEGWGDDDSKPQPGQCAAAVSVTSDTAGPGRGFNSPHAFKGEAKIKPLPGGRSSANADPTATHCPDRVNENINALLRFALKRGLLKKEDYIWAANQLIGLFNQAGFKAPDLETAPPDSADLILERLLDQAVRIGLIENTGAGRDLFDTKIMGLLTPRPSEVIRCFRKFYKQSPIAATDFFYDLNLAVNYVRKSRTDRNISWFTPSQYGTMAITINVSKPEKDPRDIAAAENAPATGYPACLLCRENEGFFGNPSHPARQNLRLIPLEMGGEEWFLQYSPYVYYNEHCIILSREHRPMKIGRRTFENLIAFLDYLPHYFIGSNADLPIVGGSILNHDHYQGGRHDFPMDKAEVEKEYRIFPGLSLGRLRWPLSGLRLKGSDAGALIGAAEKILAAWRNWTDESVGLLAESGGERHNTITPIARNLGGDYVFDLVLRNNRVTAEHPLGLFHPHEDVHNVKKENIGLIEALGLAILPPRLAAEMEMLKESLLAGRAEIEGGHAAWYPKLKKELSGLGPQETEEGLRRAVGLKFIKGLEDAGVFKRDEAGLAAFDRFVNSLAGK